MNRIQGIAAGAVVVGSILLKQTASVAPTSVQVHGSLPSTSVAKTIGGSEEGPWLASCKYWEAARYLFPESMEKVATGSIPIKEKGTATVSTEDAKRKSETSKCPVDESTTFPLWGSPRKLKSSAAEIHAIIAMVPDPVQTHLALDFDRDIDALIQGAGDNGAFALEQEPRKSSLQSAQDSLDFWIQKLNGVVSFSIVGPREKPQAALNCMVEIEKCYAKACEALLHVILIPYWEHKRVGLIEGDDLVELPIKAHALPKEDAGSRSHTPLQLRTSSVGEEPMHIRVAEEFLAIRYVSLIRAVLVNMSRMLLLISAVFVLTIVAWNSYPFQPRQLIDEGFTALLLLLGTGVIWVFAQMHRDPILSRITDTSANELGSDFYLRILAFGTVPVLTWLAYQFPEVWGTVLRFIQPSLGAFK